MNETTPSSPDFVAMRHAMVVSQLRTSAVNDPRVIAAMGEVPRENFVPAAQRAFAYRDAQLPLNGARMMNTPLATGRLLVAAEIRSTDHVLLIGAAGGYTAALIARLAKSVVALEEDSALVAMAVGGIMGTQVVTASGPLNQGWADSAPYDLIVIDGAVETVPEAIVEQLAPGGRLVTGVVDRGVTRLAVGRRTGGGFGLVDFVDMECAVLPGFARPKTFQFAR